MTNVPYHEGITGASLSGSSPAQNRTYTLANTGAIIEQMQIIIENTILQANIDFTFDEDSGIMTFLNNVWDAQNISLDYFVDDSTSTAVYLSDSANFTGADLTGSDLETNRAFIFVNNKAIVSEQMQVTVANTVLQIGVDYTFNSTSKVITFLNAVADTSNISIDYLYLGSTYYCTTKQLVDYSGLGVEVQLENLGTGDASTKSFNSKFGNIIDTTPVLYYGTTTGANNLNIMIEGTDYQIALNDGRVFLFESGLTKLSTDILYLSYVYSPRHSDSLLATYLPKANNEVDRRTGNYWGVVKSNTQYFDGYTSGYSHTDRPYGITQPDLPEFELDEKGVQSITSISFLDNTGTVSSTVDSDYIRFSEEGRVLVGFATIPNGKRNVQIIFTHGYSTTPENIQELTALIGGLMSLVNISGGSYKDISTYSVGRKSFSIGQIYVNVRESINQMKNRIDTILENMGYNYGVV